MMREVVETSWANRKAITGYIEGYIKNAIKYGHLGEIGELAKAVHEGRLHEFLPTRSVSI